ncbi:MAG: hypothetical protein M3436_12810 [Pseudomonadota bacterium]|nr:hypothetical protein [Pseudomonadota bacterium]
MDLGIVNRASLGPESGNFRAIASSARQAGPSLGLAFIGPRYQISGPFVVSHNAESVRIRALDACFYVFDGDHFDGKVQAVRVSRGNEVLAIWFQQDPFVYLSAR